MTNEPSLQVPRLPTIHCAVCKRPVDEAVFEESELLHGIRVTARCHGAEDSMLLGKAFLYSLENDELEQLMRQGGVAFQAKEIAEA